MNTIEEKLLSYAGKVEHFLSQSVSTDDKDLLSLYASMRYSVMAGGKRIRPFLVLSVAKMLGGREENAIYLAAALEMVHTYSLIHDDLPCMDDDDLRRGKPTNHKIYGEAVATLAGDALLTGAFELIAASGLSDKAVRHAVLTLASAAGADGMVGGQIMDLSSSEEDEDFNRLIKMHSLKTGALMVAAVKLGLLCAEGATEADATAFTAYARYLGLAFQIVDDVLDVVGDEAELGKSVGKDKEAGKKTFLHYLSPEEAMQYATEITERAKASIAGYPANETLTELADYLLKRQK
ncbi:MAG: polyprenyl synthetase family protein [Clostridia bacterium]|nr:polyprenyl synthetase family protein [Clostridia bacterium]